MKKSKRYYFGNICIVASLAIFLSMGYPIISAYLFPKNIPSLSNRAYTLWIPKIHASSILIPNVDPWNESVYKEALKHGVALAKGFAQPGEKGVIYIFAHSSGLPWELTQYNTVFLRLGELQIGDEIIIWRNQKEFRYVVTGRKEVTPGQVDEVTKQKGDILILQTCTPIGTDWNRLLIFAKEVP